MQSRISDITSPVQVGPALKAVALFKATPAQTNALLLAFIRALKKLSGDARSFLESNRTMPIAGDLDVFFEATKINGANNYDLVAAIRDYFVQHLSAARCGGADSMKQYNAIVDRFNKGIEAMAFANGNPLRPINQDEIKSAKIEGAVEIVEFWQSPTAKPFLLKLKQLRFGIGEQPNSTGRKALTENERTEVKWQKQLTEFLQDFRAWRADHERSESDYFHQKCIALMALRELVPDEATREAVLREYVGVLNDSPLQRDQPMEWLLHVQPLLRYSRAEDTTKIHTMIQSSGSLSLVLYAKLERLFPQKTK